MNSWIYQYHNNLLITPKGIKIKLPKDFKDYLIVKKLWLGIMSSYPHNVNNENVYAFTEDGELAWQIEKCPETSGSFNYFYDRFDNDYKNDELVKIINWNYYEVLVEAATGKIKELTNTLPDWKVDGDLVFCPNGAKVKLPFEVMEYYLVFGKLLVLVRPPSGMIMSENAFLIAPSGTIIWQVESIPETKNDLGGLYIGYYDEDEKSVRLISFSCMANYVDINTGKSLKTMFVK